MVGGGGWSLCIFRDFYGGREKEELTFLVILAGLPPLVLVRLDFCSAAKRGEGRDFSLLISRCSPPWGQGEIQQSGQVG